MSFVSLYNQEVKSWDVIVIGGGIIGVSLALELRHHGATVLIVERGEPGREASHAGAGMLAALDPDTRPPLRELALASARLYPEFITELEAESGMKIDFRRNGTIYLSSVETSESSRTKLTEIELHALEPALESVVANAYMFQEDSVDPRDIMAAATEVAKKRGVEIAKGSPATELILDSNRVAGVRTTRTEFVAPVVVNCCGAWSGEVAPLPIPTRPVKGQLLSVVFPHRRPGQLLLRHVVRGAKSVYLVPRSDGRILIGATVEEAGFDKCVDIDTIQQLHQAAAKLVPEIGEARIHESWAGLRPGTPDGLPIMGETSLSGYFVATGHYRNGILLAPITAAIMSRLIRGANPEFDMSPYLPNRLYIDEENIQKRTAV